MSLEKRDGSELKGFVLDLRNNPGDYYLKRFQLKSFLDQGEIVSTRDREGRRTL